MRRSTFDDVDPAYVPPSVQYCPECGYDLHMHVQEVRGFCPECGIPFSTRRMRERYDRGVYRDRRDEQRAACVLSILCRLAIGVFLALVFVTLSRSYA